MTAKIWFLTATAACLAGLMAITGCQSQFDDTKIFDRYHITTLGASTSAEALIAMKNLDNELTRQDENVITTWGHNEKLQAIWFNVVAFDDEQFTATRKYAAAFQEKVRHFNLYPYQRFRFDGQIILGSDVLKEPYADEKVRKIAILHDVIANFNTDIAKSRLSSQVLDSTAMIVTQTLNEIVNKLEQSPALTARLYEPAGLEFDQMNLNKGRIRMIIKDNIVNIKLMVGKVVNDFQKHPDVADMEQLY